MCCIHHFVLLISLQFILIVPIAGCSFALISKLSVTGHKLSWNTQIKAFWAHVQERTRINWLNPWRWITSKKPEMSEAQPGLLLWCFTRTKEKNSCCKVQGGQQYSRKCLSFQVQAPCTAERKPFKNHSEPPQPLSAKPKANTHSGDHAKIDLPSLLQRVTCNIKYTSETVKVNQGDDR